MHPDSKVHLITCLPCSGCEVSLSGDSTGDRRSNSNTALYTPHLVHILYVDPAFVKFPNCADRSKFGDIKYLGRTRKGGRTAPSTRLPLYKRNDQTSMEQKNYSATVSMGLYSMSKPK